MQSKGLTDISVEVLQIIASYLDQPDYASLRLVSKGIERSLFRAFALKFFDCRVKFMQTDYSLQLLFDMSQSRLGPYLKNIAIGCEILCHISLDDRCINTATELQRFSAINKFNQLCDDQAILLSTGHAQLMLVEVFRNLPHLEVVEICSFSQDLYNPGIGASQIFRETMVDIRSNVIAFTYNKADSASTLSNVLFALGKAGVRPKQLYLDMRITGLPDAAFNIPSFMEKSVLPVLSNLERCDCRVALEQPRPFRTVVPTGKPRPQPLPSYHLQTFLANLSQIKVLHLGAIDGANKYRFFKWLAAPVSTERYDSPLEFKPPSSPSLAKLTELRLSEVEIPFCDLISVVQKSSSTLRKLSLYKVTLITDPDDGWAGPCARLACAGSRLEEVSMQVLYLSVGNNGIGRSRTILRFNGARGFSYAGPNMRKAIGRLVPVAKLGADQNLSFECKHEALTILRCYRC
ncbi:hypothetical protein GGR54DRAFT_157297 [Hypoxylon sp. NC1633]|nr:hypothetical protein GGR54DRAFT_157297 [Hypoxylon sp. NC1633]